MKGFPNTLATKADLLNCLALVQATPPAFPASDLAAAIEQIEAGAWLHCPIVDRGEKTVTVMYCAEAKEGQITGNGPRITSVSHEQAEDAEQGDTPEKTVLTLSSPITAGEAELLIPAPYTTAQRMGVTQAELDSIKGVLNSL